MAPEHERVFGAIGPIRHFWSAEFSCDGLWPNSLRVTIRLILFDLFAKGCVQIKILIIRAYFSESSGLYK